MERKYYGCIYVLWIDNKPYVGQSRVLDKDDLPTQRWKRHIADSKTLDIPVYKAIRDYGIQKKEVVEYIPYNEQENIIQLLNTAEINWVTKLNSRLEQFGGNGYNCAQPGGGYPKIPHTEEHKKYMSNLMKGRKRSEETKQKIRDVLKGKPLNDTIKQNIKKGKEEAYYKKFPNKLQEWVDFYNKNNHIPKSQTGDKIEQHLYEWHCTVRYKKQNNTLRQEIIDILNTTPGWIWEYPDEFQEQFNKWKNIIETHRETNLVKIQPRTLEIKKSILWVKRIQRLKRERSLNLTEKQIEQLNTCPEWSWENKTRDGFKKNHERWVTFYKKNNKQPTRITDDQDEKKVFIWQSYMRQNYKKGESRLTKEMIDVLNSTVGWTWEGR